MTLSPHESIRTLLGTYCELMDAADWAAVGALFADARLIDGAGTLVAEGASGVRALYERGTRLYDGSPCTRHITANSIIEVDGDSATARSSYVVFQRVADLPLQPIISGRYRDTFTATDGTWRFAVRQFYVDQLGDISHHLTFEVRTS